MCISPNGCSFSYTMYVIVDLETSGGNPLHDRIVEIAAYLFDGERIVDELVTLIDPETNIPAYITSLTGISNAMVAGAPKFYEVAKKLVKMTEGCVFVAHNSPFDYGFIRNEFKRLGYDYNRPSLCTVRWTRKLIPGLPSYSLGNLCQSLNIQLEDRHRAAGDALATVKLFRLLLSKNEGEEINATRDISDYMLMAYCLEKDVPTFAVCRGEQVMSIVSGCTFIQDIPNYYKEQGATYNDSHRMPVGAPDRTYARHDVVINKDASKWLYKIVGSTELKNVSSWHHQAVGGVEGTNLTVVSTATIDGVEIIEAVERQDKTFCLGVQFHPENDCKFVLYTKTPEKALCDYETCLNFFEMLVEYAGK